MSLKLVPFFMLLVLGVALGIGQAARSADADVESIQPSATSMESGSTPITILVPLIAPTPATTDVRITILGLDDNVNMTGLLFLQACVPGCPDDAGESTTSDATPIDVDETVVAQTQLVLRLSLTCEADDSVTVTAFTPVAPTNSEDVQSVIIDCIAVEGPPDPGDVIEGGQVAATATPNLLPCGGGTSVIKAEVVGLLGEILEDAEFRFETTAGLIVQTGPDTAKLTLGANQTEATVTAKIFDPDPEAEEPKTATVIVSLDCNDAPALVVTASPNVVNCTGTTTITASVRDANGHVVTGRGYHFVTSAGLLTVLPNNADTEEGLATLTLRPGDGDATVVVSSGILHGTIEDIDANENNFVVDETALVTVKQNCLSTTTGQIKVNSSTKNVSCGENVFIGLSVVDEDIQTVVDATPLTLIASLTPSRAPTAEVSNGGFYGGEGTFLQAAQVPTSHGEANAIYTAPSDYNGEVKITAASGDVYGFTKLNVACAVAAPSTGGGTGSAPCVPIGDGVCIQPPNTGRSLITPPSTGSAGLK